MSPSHQQSNCLEQLTAFETEITVSKEDCNDMERQLQHFPVFNSELQDRIRNVRKELERLGLLVEKLKKFQDIRSNNLWNDLEEELLELTPVMEDSQAESDFSQTKKVLVLSKNSREQSQALRSAIQALIQSGLKTCGRDFSQVQIDLAGIRRSIQQVQNRDERGSTGRKPTLES